MMKPQAFGKRVSLVRMAFGVIVAIDAAFKWQPAFQNGFVGHLATTQGEASIFAWWINLWHTIIAWNPHLFAILTAGTETLLALSLLLGVFRKPLYLVGTAFFFMVWTIAEGFGGPYGAGSTDIGTAILYAVVFMALYGLEMAVESEPWTLEPWLRKQIARLGSTHQSDAFLGHVS